jgi:hypothetical protein
MKANLQYPQLSMAGPVALFAFTTAISTVAAVQD